MAAVRIAAVEARSAAAAELHSCAVFDRVVGSSSAVSLSEEARSAVALRM